MQLRLPEGCQTAGLPGDPLESSFAHPFRHIRFAISGGIRQTNGSDPWAEDEGVKGEPSQTVADSGRAFPLVAFAGIFPGRAPKRQFEETADVNVNSELALTRSGGHYACDLAEDRADAG